MHTPKGKSQGPSWDLIGHEPKLVGGSSADKPDLGRVSKIMPLSNSE